MTLCHGIESENGVPEEIHVFGDMPGEWFYGFIMVAVVCGIIGGYSDIKEDQVLTPKDCPRCGTRNSGDEIYCLKCAMVLDSKAALMIDESVTVVKEISEYETILAAQRKEPGIGHE